VDCGLGQYKNPDTLKCGDCNDAAIGCDSCESVAHSSGFKVNCTAGADCYN